MKSRMSCCNAALLRRVLSRTALLWIAYLLIWVVALPANLLNISEWDTALEVQRRVLNAAANSCHVVAFCYGLAVAWFLFLHLHRSRSANFFGALPLRRETMFSTLVLAGFLCSLVPNFLIMGATMLAGSAIGVGLIWESAIWFAAQTLTYVFYFGLAVLCTMAVGNVIAMPCLYVVLNCLVAVVEVVTRTLLEGLLYGFRFTREMKLSQFSPIVYTYIEGNGPECNSRYLDGELVEISFSGWEMLLILALVGLGFLVAAFFLHKYRRMEVAGDVMAIKPLKPVFLYVFTFGCALVGGTVLAEIVVPRMESQHFLPICACVVGCTVAGYFLGEMILLRTVRVLRKRNLLRCGICVVLVVVALTCVRLDVLGIESYIPDGAEVTGVKLDAARHAVEDPAQIAQTIALHQEILDRKTETEALSRQNVWDPEVEITYVLENGREVCRYYRLPVSEDEPAQPDSLIYKYEQLINTPEMILSRELPQQDMTVSNIKNCEIHYYFPENNYGSRIDPTAAEAYQLWVEAMVPDFKAGNMGQTHYSVITAKESVAETYSDVAVEFELYAGDHTEHYFYHIPVTAVQTMGALIEMGVPAEAFAIPNE